MRPSIQVVVSPTLPIPPSDAVRARRLVRHGMADVLAWLGEDVGPEPDALAHVLLSGNTAFVSAEMATSLGAGL